MNAVLGARLSPEEMYLKSQGLETRCSLEEIYLISKCTAKEKRKIIIELWECFKAADHDMKELINRAIGKVEKLTDAELEVILNYPLEDN